MITLNEYLYRPIITQELFDIFEEFINSTYNENVLCESLLFEGKEKREKQLNAVIDFLKALLSVRRQINDRLEHLDDIINDNIRKDVETQYHKYADEYNKLFPKYVKDNKEISPTKLLKTDNKNEITQKEIVKIAQSLSSDFSKFINKDGEHEGYNELNKFADTIAEFENTIEKRVEKSEEKRKAKEAAEELVKRAAKEEKLKQLLNDYNKAVEEWQGKLDNLKEWKSWNKNIGNEYKEQLAILSQVKASTTIDIEKGNEKALKTFINKKNEYCEYISNIIKNLEEEENALNDEQQKMADAAAETPEDAEVTPEVKQTAETEENIIKNALVKKVASEVNIDVVSLGKLYVQITKQLSESNKLTKEMVDTIANTNDDDAIIGLNLMLLGAVTTKNLPNRAKIISEYCTIIQKSIEQKKYDKIFNKQSKKESN